MLIKILFLEIYILFKIILLEIIYKSNIIYNNSPNTNYIFHKSGNNN